MKNDLKHLRRSELIDLIYEMKKREIELQTRLDEAEAKLQAREITMEKAGSIADAAVQLSGVFQAAQKAADTYLKSIKAKEKEFYVSTEGEPAIKQLEAEQNEQVKKKGRKAEPETVTADSAVKKQEEFEAMKKKTRNMLLGLVAVIVAAVAGIAAYKAMH